MCNRTCAGELLVNGVQLGNVFIGVQPALGVEGDPMRLLFEKDLTPHPQYAAFYRQFLQHDFGADAVVHFGMHGTGAGTPALTPAATVSLHQSSHLTGLVGASQPCIMQLCCYRCRGQRRFVT